MIYDKDLFAQADVDNDGLLTLEEYTSFTMSSIFEYFDKSMHTLTNISDFLQSDLFVTTIDTICREDFVRMDTENRGKISLE